jgi:hypothetical protein
VRTAGCSPSRGNAATRAGWAAGSLGLLALYLALAPRLPDLGSGAGAVALYALVPLALAGWAIFALHDAAGRPPAVALGLFAVAAVPAVLLALADVEALATPLKVAAAAGLGFWLAGLLDAAWQLAVLAGVATLVDIASVAAGPTNELVENAPRAVEVLALHLPAWGGDADVLIGATDILFLAAFLGGAIALGLRARLTLVCMVLALTLAVGVSAAADTGLPGLPFMAVALLAVNADLILPGRVRGGRS